MDKYAQLVELLKGKSGIGMGGTLFNATVTSVEGEYCTVDINGLEITEVRLKATINEAENYCLIIPKARSMVTLGSFSGDFRDLAVLKVDEIETIEYVQDNLQVTIDTRKGKIAVNNTGKGIGLHSLLIELVDLLQNFSVNTPAGPSLGLIVPTQVALTQFSKNIQELVME
ncbi:MAG: hypothetical protein LUG18_15200 [Candidatus Azobacteroides sp.]|nr:hypothetical protein [Candidatus Azobacteroides sp.]